MARICLSLIGIAALHGFATSAAADENAATRAYELRMKGKADQAKALLEQATSQTPNDAAAHYELARTQFHMALGSGQLTNLDSDMKRVRDSIERAMEADPSNVIYPFFAGHVGFFQAYMSLSMGTPDIKTHLTRAIEAFEAALALKPDYHQAMLYLVELCSQFPEDKGGDKSRAEKYARKLEAMNAVYGAKARSILSEKDAQFWQGVLDSHPSNIDILEEQGNAYLRTGKTDDAVRCFEKAVAIDPRKAGLFLDLSIYHTFSAIRAREDHALLQKHLKAGDAAVTRYIESKPIQPMLAYAFGVQFKYKMHSGAKEQADALMQKAEALDPFFSKATGSPGADLFIPPGEISRNHRYLMRPF